jgi:tricarballylate dehydrogenase
MAESYDVVVVGGGNAALCSALAAQQGGAKVMVIEKAPEDERGGNSLFTAGGFRFPHNGLEDLRKDVLTDLTDGEAAAVEVPPYTADTFAGDLDRMTESLSDETLSGLLVGRARETIVWMREQGVRWILMFNRQSYKVGNVHRFWGGLNIESVGGGHGLVESLYDRCNKVGIGVAYGTGAKKLRIDQKGRVIGVTVRGPDGYRDIDAKAVVLACGGFEANPEMRCRYLGPDWELAKVRGTRHNTGDGLRMALEIGAQPFGHFSSCHAVQWDMSAPEFGDRVVLDNFQKHSYPLGLIVNVRGERFLDEGADFRNFTYARYGREVLKQPKRLAFQVFDSKTIAMTRAEYRIRQVTKAEANSLEELADHLEIDREGFVRTIKAYNAACQGGEFNPAVLDGVKTLGITPPKSNWAQPIDKPPYYGFGVTCGITFTFGGVRVDGQCRVLDTEDRSIPGLFAAGEMVGGIFYQNYPGGSGLMSGSVFGKLAGEGAAQYVKH